VLLRALDRREEAISPSNLMLVTQCLLQVTLFRQGYNTSLLRGRGGRAPRALEDSHKLVMMLERRVRAAKPQDQLQSTLYLHLEGFPRAECDLN
jgi:hypothetical protein